MGDTTLQPRTHATLQPTTEPSFKDKVVSAAQAVGNAAKSAGAAVDKAVNGSPQYQKMKYDMNMQKEEAKYKQVNSELRAKADEAKLPVAGDHKKARDAQYN